MYSPGKIPRTAKREVRKSQIDFFVKSKESGNISRMQPAIDAFDYLHESKPTAQQHLFYVYFFHSSQTYSTWLEVDIILLSTFFQMLLHPTLLCKVL